VTNNEILVANVTINQDWDKAQLSAADEQVLRELTEQPARADCN
jgi:hypothetical protein